MAAAIFDIEPHWVYDPTGKFLGIEVTQSDEDGDEYRSHVTIDHCGAHNQSLPRGLIRIPIPRLSNEEVVEFLTRGAKSHA